MGNTQISHPFMPTPDTLDHPTLIGSKKKAGKKALNKGGKKTSNKVGQKA